MFELMAKAENVDAVIAIESRLSEVLYELESIKSSLRVYDNQVLYSTIYLNINEVKLTSTTGEASFSDSHNHRASGDYSTRSAECCTHYHCQKDGKSCKTQESIAQRI